METFHQRSPLRLRNLEARRITVVQHIVGLAKDMGSIPREQPFVTPVPGYPMPSSVTRYACGTHAVKILTYIK